MVAKFLGAVIELSHDIALIVEFNTKVGDLGKFVVLKVFYLVEEPVGEKANYLIVMGVS